MTASEPRVRVDSGTFEGGSAIGNCGACGMIVAGHPAYGRYKCWLAAMDAAHRHAATCPALRLARLLRELEALREKWLGIAYRSYSGDRALGYNMALSLAGNTVRDPARNLELIRAALDGATVQDLLDMERLGTAR